MYWVKHESHDYPLQRITKKKKRIMNNFDYRFIDGEGYFASVADAIKKAKEEIFITDWWYVFSLFTLFVIYLLCFLPWVQEIHPKQYRMVS